MMMPPHLRRRGSAYQDSTPSVSTQESDILVTDRNSLKDHNR
jgi:hypothetical protein